MSTKERSVHVLSHVLYGGAHLFKRATIEKLGSIARASMEQYGQDDQAFGLTVGAASERTASLIASRVRAKLASRPIEAICIDFEDGYGVQADEKEDLEADRVGAELAAMPPSAAEVHVGIRIKALAPLTLARADQTLSRVLRAAATGLPAHFTVTLPKVTTAADVHALIDRLTKLEQDLALPTIGIELMIESPRALLDDRGAVAIPALVKAAGDRLVALHLGAYDLTAALGVTAADQRLDHPFCDFARTLMAFGAAADGIPIADGATTLMPIPPKNAATDEEKAAAVHRAWSLHAKNVRRAIDFGMWQGWDLHPAQLPARYGALFAYFLDRREEMAERLCSFIDKATQAGRVGQAFDDAATGRGLVSFFHRGLRCGALDDADVLPTSLTRAEITSSSFDAIVESRTKR